MSNRCAYLIGKSQIEREEIKKKFKEIYRVRSNIVHRGKVNLDSKERFLFIELQQICNRVIAEEMKSIR